MCFFFFLNIDGAVQKTTDLSIVGGVFRDETGKWLLGYNWF